MLAITATAEWRTAHPGGMIGLLELSGIDNTQPSPALEERKRLVEAALRERYKGFTRPDFLALPVMVAYDRYYKRFNKTYHVQLQLESIVMKGKNLPSVSPLVDANFAAELDTLILTAGHDVQQLSAPVIMDVSRPGEHITQMNGETKEIHAGDMLMRDLDGICCTVIYGQDHRSPIRPATAHVLYVSYVPAGVPGEVVESHLQRIAENVRLFAPRAILEQQRVIHAG
jgi:DNA/RNA-binding domain of Phe-tRNA-synthetase-like protein